MTVPSDVFCAKRTNLHGQYDYPSDARRLLDEATRQRLSPAAQARRMLEEIARREGSAPPSTSPPRSYSSRSDDPVRFAKARMEPIFPSETGSTNVYRDLGYQDPESMMRKASMVAKLFEGIGAAKLDSARAAALIGCDGATLSQLACGRFRDVSEGKLSDMLARLAWPNGPS